ncbi:MAG TPA: haloacid dehalogenase type II [Methylomirabilota bacterium]|nr:haloacid dehalogenase type II [Methylomirabilota bacterium]
MDLHALLFDTYGTLVDWRTSVRDELAAFGAGRGLHHDWEAFLAEWKACYRPGMDAVNRGEAPWTTVETIYHRRLVELLAARGIAASEAEVAHLTRAWWRLTPWPDTVPGLARLRRGHVISPLSNASFTGMVHLAKFAGLPWDCVITAENARCYKPRPEVYRTALALLDLRPEQAMMVAAHNYDLAAAQALGLRTAFVPRPLEHGPGQTSDLAPEGKWDVVVDSVEELAGALGA